jgi:NAD-dependent SIR2 family protein deacetylase
LTRWLEVGTSLPNMSVEIPGFGFAVTVKTDCPHVDTLTSLLSAPTEEEASAWLTASCSKCDSASENWVSVATKKVYCSRYVNGHMLDQWERTRAELNGGRYGAASADASSVALLPPSSVAPSSAATANECVAISFSDLSVWCFECDCYIQSPSTRPWLEALHKAKFGDGKRVTVTVPGPTTSVPKPKEARAASALADPVASVWTSSSWTTESQALERREGLLSAVKEGQIKRVIAITGAGMSVAAGIPDFRSKTGIYHSLAGLGIEEGVLEAPEDLFCLEFFRENPVPFYKVASQLFGDETIKPTRAHRFLKLLESKGVLRRVFTQNIDGLEFKAGISEERVVQCHGGMRSAHCIGCGASVDIAVVEAALLAIRESGTVTVPTCEDCGATIKPDITFFGEDLPKHFFAHLHKDVERPSGEVEASPVDQGPADLVIVMGTSLKVAPVCILPDMFPTTTHRVLMNLESAGDIGIRDKDLELLGPLEDTVVELASAFGWAEELAAMSPEE